MENSVKDRFEYVDKWYNELENYIGKIKYANEEHKTPVEILEKELELLFLLKLGLFIRAGKYENIKLEDNNDK